MSHSVIIRRLLNTVPDELLLLLEQIESEKSLELNKNETEKKELEESEIEK